MIENFLNKIIEDKKAEIAEAKAECPYEHLKAALPSEKPKSLRDALAGAGPNIIAEVKRASPSRGILVEDYDPAAIAKEYEGAGAKAISVLTDAKYFRGSLDDLRRVKHNVDLPCLRKDFIIDPYQIYEARAYGADAVLLIVKCLTDEELRELFELTVFLGMDALVEVHDEHEVPRAVKAGAKLIGINNRNLEDFVTDLDISRRLKGLIPDGVVAISESGIKSADDIIKLRSYGFGSFLVGEGLVTKGDRGKAIRELMGY